MAGKDLAEGFNAVLFSLIGDLDYFFAVLQLPNYSLAKGPCSLCQCQLGGHFTWTNMSSTAPWLGTIWRRAEWLAWDEKSPIAFFSLPGASCHMVSLDWLHCKYLGHDLYFYGSVFHLLCAFVLPADDATNLKTCWTFLKRYYKENNIPSPFRYLNKVSMYLRKGKYPKLRGKGSEVRHLNRPMQALWRNYMNPALKVHKMIDLYLRLNVRVEQILTDCATVYALPQEHAHAFKQSMFQMMQLANQLAEHFLLEELQLFDMTTKAHFCLHIALLAEHVNPRCTWAFRGEDLMQKMQVLAKSCVRGNNGPMALRKVARHYRLGLHLLFLELED